MSRSHTRRATTLRDETRVEARVVDQKSCVFILYIIYSESESGPAGLDPELVRTPGKDASMKIVVLVKEVPDTYGDRKLDLDTGLADREASDAVVDEIGERALEAALSHADGVADTEVVVMVVGPDSATSNIRKMLAMGADSAVHVVDDGLLGADLGLTAEVIASDSTTT